eukprot:3561287-Rhodomonas_salina.1
MIVQTNVVRRQIFLANRNSRAKCDKSLQKNPQQGDKKSLPNFQTTIDGQLPQPRVIARVQRRQRNREQILTLAARKNGQNKKRNILGDSI